VAPGVVSSTSPPADPELLPDELLDPELDPLLLDPEELPELLDPPLLDPLDPPLLDPPSTPPMPGFPLDTHAAGSHASATASVEKTPPRPTPRKACLFMIPGAAPMRSVSRAAYRPAQGAGIMSV
jgi:hypothetical protein